jgi:CDP-paratose 2-epimerase
VSVAVITGSAGLVGSEAATYFAARGLSIVGIDNDMRSRFFGDEASTLWMRERLKCELRSYTHYDVDIRNEQEVFQIFQQRRNEIALVVHAAAQPSHDWAATNPAVDLSINTIGTSVMLEATRRFSPDAVFIFMSTNKVYGDLPNYLPLIEQEMRWEIEPNHCYSSGISEDMPVDRSMHSLFGVSKLAADLLVQEYGRYFGMRTACFRGGCLTGPNHSGTQLHGFLAYLMKCVLTSTRYQVFGYKGKQVRDNIHSADLIRAFDEFFRSPRSGEVYNMGGGRFSNCSVLEAIRMCEEISGEKLEWQYIDISRKGDHQWWISDYSRFRSHYPNWQPVYEVRKILTEIYEAQLSKVQAPAQIR